MHRAAVWQHSSNSNIKIVHNSIEHFLWNPSDFSSNDVLSCLWIVFINSVFQIPPEKIVRWVETLRIGWLGVIGLMESESAPLEVMPEVFKSSVGEMRWHLISWTEHLHTSGITSRGTDSFRVKQITLAILSPRTQPAGLFSQGVLERQSLWKQSTDKRGHHQKRSQMDSTRNAQ